MTEQPHSWVGPLLDGAGLSWALLRRASPQRPNGDVDVLLAPADAGRAAAALEAAGFVRLPWARQTLSYLRYDRASGAWLWLDLQTHVGTQDRRLPAAVVGEILARRAFVDGAWALAPADEFWLLGVEILLNGRPLLERYRRRLAALLSAASASDPLARWVDWLARQPGIAAAVLADVAAADWSALEGRRRRPQPVAGMGRRLAGAAQALVRPAARGVSVALLGPDGAGKSSAGQRIVDGFPFRGRLIYMGIGGPPGKRRRSLPALLVMTPVGLLVQWRRYLAGRALQLRGQLVVFDRYMEEIWLPQPPEPSAVRRAGRRLRRVLSCPPPDMMVVLDSPGTVMFERKAEHDPAWLEAERQRYLRFSEQMPGVSVVDNTRSQDEVIRDINVILWERLSERLIGASGHRKHGPRGP